MADTFMQSDLQCILSIYALSGNRSHDLGTKLCLSCNNTLFILNLYSYNTPTFLVHIGVFYHISDADVTLTSHSRMCYNRMYLGYYIWNYENLK